MKDKLTYENKVEREESRSFTFNGLDYYEYDLAIVVYDDEGRQLGTIYNDSLSAHLIAESKNILGMTEEIRSDLLQFIKENERSEVTNYDLIAFGIDPIESGWEDGGGNHLSRDGWGEYVLENSEPEL